MALVASALIDAALKRSFGGTGRQKVSKAALLEELSYQDQLVVQMASQIAPDLLATTTGVVTITDVGNTNGYSLSAGLHYRDFVHVDTTNERYIPINMVQRQHRESYPKAPAAMLRLGSTSAVFHPIDPQGKRWTGTGTRNFFNATDGHTVSYSYVPLPSTISSLSDSLSSPDMAREAIVSSLELQVLMMSNMKDEVRLQAALAKRQGAWDSLRMQMYKFMAPQGQPGGKHRYSTMQAMLDRISG